MKQACHFKKITGGIDNDDVWSFEETLGFWKTCITMNWIASQYLKTFLMGGDIDECDFLDIA